MHLRNQDQHSQTDGTYMSSLSQSVVNQQSQHQVPLCLQCHDGSYLSLSLSTPVPILPGKQQCFRLQSQGYQSVQTSVKPHCSCTLSNLRCSTTHVLSQKHVATKPRSLTKQIRPSRFSCQTFSFQLPSPGMTPGSVAPRTVHSVRPGSTTT